MVTFTPRGRSDIIAGASRLLSAGVQYAQVAPAEKDVTDIIYGCQGKYKDIILMNSKLELHHFAHRIRPGTLEFVLELFEKLGCPLKFRDGDARWAMVRQARKNVNIQLVEYDEQPESTDTKLRTHIAFLSQNPLADIDQIQQWVTQNGKRFTTGGWNDRERWFDLPDIFVDFVIEVMDVKVVE